MVCSATEDATLLLGSSATYLTPTERGIEKHYQNGPVSQTHLQSSLSLRKEIDRCAVGLSLQHNSCLHLQNQRHNLNGDAIRLWNFFIVQRDGTYISKLPRRTNWMCREQNITILPVAQESMTLGGRQPPSFWVTSFQPIPQGHY